MNTYRDKNLANNELTYMPLSFAQERLWFLDQLEGGSATYNISGSLKITGNLSHNALKKAIQEIITRHEALRTNFDIINDKPIQIIKTEAQIEIPIIDLQKLKEVEQKREVERLTISDAQKVFDLKKDLLLRISLLQLNDEFFVLLINMHHIISDGWSIGVFIKELTT